MGKWIFALLMIGARQVFAADAVEAAKTKDLSDYSGLVCVVQTRDDEDLATFDERFIVVKMDDRPGLFQQMRLQSGLDQIQLQVLLEEDFDGKENAVNVLVNFAVNDEEISSEFSAQNVNYVSIKNKEYKATCDIK